MGNDLSPKYSDPIDNGTPEYNQKGENGEDEFVRQVHILYLFSSFFFPMTFTYHCCMITKTVPMNQ